MKRMKQILVTIALGAFVKSVFIPLGVIIAGLSFMAGDCTPDTLIPVTGKIAFKFEHFVNNDTAVFDKMIYTNEAGNPWELTLVQWFISDVTLHKKNGDSVVLNKWTFYHYIDTDIPSTLNWDVVDPVDTGTYDHISFIFGFKGERNKPFMFVNPPESQMFWPYYLGGDSGGYHYMKLNGFWKDLNNIRRGYNFHLGVGQYQDVNGNRIKVKQGDDSTFIFVQNWFKVDLPSSFFSLQKDKTKEITIRMNIESWFKTPHVYDHNYWGPDVMENQRALKTIKENGFDVFTVSSIKDR
ncbi:MAG TPA: hypothetical protein P5050_02960 [Bacteroidia bacterium]|nr:hypothetical protein [Bacteroidia bacterium]HRS58158.1 hypothetical protein [Bacteroidia bacterium]HRU67488.1 hypothetical protein [Bacteroidia bacterium]